MTKNKIWENNYKEKYVDIPKLSIKETLNIHTIIEKWDNATTYASRHFKEANTGCMKILGGHIEINVSVHHAIYIGYMVVSS